MDRVVPRQVILKAAVLASGALVIENFTDVFAEPKGKKEEQVATIEFEAGNPTPNDVYVTGEGYETDRIVYVSVTKPDASIEELTTGVLFDGGKVAYRYPLSGAGVYHFEHSQRRHLHGQNDSLDLKAEADFTAS